MTLSAEQLAVRRTRIGGSEIGALLGIDPHRNSHDVFLDKTLPASDRPRAHLEWGSTVEWSILEYHARLEDLTIERPGTLVHPDFAHVCATPDGIGRKAQQEDADRRVIEAKNVGRWMAGGWGEEDGDDAPFHYLAQVHWEMGVAIRLGLASDVGHLVAAIAGEAPRKYEVKFDADLYAGLVEVAARFVRDHLDTGKPPEGTPAEEAEYIRRRYAKNNGTLLQPTEELLALWREVEQLRAAHKDAEAAKEAAETALKAALGEADGIEGVCTWKLQKGSTYMVTKEPARVLRAWPKKKQPKEG